MPNSLKCRLKKLKHQGLLSEKDLSRIYTDNDVTEELEKIKAEIEEDKKLYSYNEHIQKGHSNCIDIVNSHISELEGENE